ncbi:hypothetical protein LCI18_006702 [Fusarium solani-melongenae]|uniref:Uncharacterized protein n=1 Tax=Fusarium solani subsp. cucurbitae TaxID=2747967 RepID=A0ACD3Z3U8_FUSSC|nr:hypothetical protein LCI18_006702 [Fusarium solani-melongenae]
MTDAAATTLAGIPTTAAPSGTQRNSLSPSGKPGVRSKYAPKACQECRRRRAKCDGVHPAACSRCVGRHLTCVYTTEDDGHEPGDSPQEYSPSPSDLYVQILGDQHGVDEELETHLIEQYFIWEQPWLQAVDEALFRESRENNGRYFSPLLLNCILASGSRFTDRVEVRSDPNDPNTAGRLFLETAEVLLHFELKRPSITTIQSLAVLGTVYHAFGQDAAGWLHTGIAHRLILDMGLHLDPSSLVTSGCMKTEEAELRRQIYWSLYCVDKLAAGYTGRVCSMLVRDYDSGFYRNTNRYPKDFQGAVGMPTIPTHAQQCDHRHTLYSVSPTLQVSLHIALIKLCQILEKIFLNLAQNQYRARSNQADTAKIKSCIQTLQELSTAWVPPGQYRCSILKMIQDHPAFQQGEAATSDALTDHYDFDLNPTSEDIDTENSTQPANGVWPGPLADEMSWPSWMSIIGADPSMSEFLATEESLPSQPENN